MKATAVYSCPSLAPRVAVAFDDGETRLADPETGRYSEAAIDADFIPARVARGLARDISETEEGGLLLARVNLALERRAAAAAIGRLGGRATSPAKRAAAQRRATSRRTRTPSPLASVPELKRRILAFCVADELANGRGALPASVRAVILEADALAYRRELADRLAALPDDADLDAAAREIIGGHRLAAKLERWMWLLLATRPARARALDADADAAHTAPVAPPGA